MGSAIEPFENSQVSSLVTKVPSVTVFTNFGMLHTHNTYKQADVISIALALLRRIVGTI